MLYHFTTHANHCSLGDAEEILLQMALLEKVVEDKTLSAHRLIQSAVMRRLSDQDRTKYFDAAVQILNYGFGKEWNETTGHLFKAWKEDAWSRQGKCLPHVVHLVKHSERYQIRAGQSAKVWRPAHALYLVSGIDRKQKCHADFLGTYIKRSISMLH